MRAGRFALRPAGACLAAARPHLAAGAEPPPARPLHHPQLPASGRCATSAAAARATRSPHPRSPRRPPLSSHPARKTTVSWHAGGGCGSNGQQPSPRMADCVRVCRLIGGRPALPPPVTLASAHASAHPPSRPGHHWQPVRRHGTPHLAGRLRVAQCCGRVGTRGWRPSDPATLLRGPGCRVQHRRGQPAMLRGQQRVHRCRRHRIQVPVSLPGCRLAGLACQLAGRLPACQPAARQTNQNKTRLPAAGCETPRTTWLR